MNFISSTNTSSTLLGSTSIVYGSNSGFTLPGISNVGLTKIIYSGSNDVVTSLLMHCDGTNGSTTFTDSSSYNATLTSYNSAQISTSQYKIGTGSMYLPNAGTAYVLTPSSTNYNFGTGNFTIEFWMNWSGTYSSSGSGYQRVMSNKTGVYLSGNWIIGWDNTANNGTAHLAFATQGYPFYSAQTVLSANTSNTWYHYAFVRNGTSFYVFVNGILESISSIGSISVDSGTTNPLTIGGNPGDSQYFYGYLDEIRITKGYQQYTPNFALQNIPYTSDSNVVLLMNCEGTNGSTTFTDSSSYNATLTSTNSAQISTSQYKYGTGSLYLPNAGTAYILTPTSTNYAFGTGNFTIEFWLYWSGTYSTTGSGWQRVMSNKTGAFATNTWIIGWDNSTNNGTAHIAMQIFNVAGTPFYSSTTVPVANTWYHFAFVRNGSYIYVYTNGIVEAIYTIGTTSLDGGIACPLTIGGNPGDSQYIYGYMDEIRITKGVARYGNFTVATTPFILNSPTTLYLPGTSSPNSYLSFNINHPANFDTRYYNFFVEAWISLNSIPASGTDYYIINKGVYQYATEDIGLRILSSGYCQFYTYILSGSAITIDTGLPLQINTLYHVAAGISTNGTTGTLYIYLNGILKNSTALSTLPRYTVGSIFNIGTPIIQSDWVATNAYIQDLRVVKGGTIPTLSFTPSNIPFGMNNPTYTSNMGQTVLSLYTQHFYPTYLNLPGITGSYITLASNTTGARVNTSSSNMFIEAWCYFNTLTGTEQYIAGVNTIASQTNDDWGLRWDNNANTIQFYHYNTSGNATIVAASSAINTKQWYHIAAGINFASSSYIITTETSYSALPVSITGTVNNNTYSPGGTDYSLYFPGVLGNYLAFSDARFNTNWATGQFTFEAWVNYNNFTNTVTATPQPMSFGTMNDGGTNYWSFGANASGLLQFFYYNSGTVNVISTSQPLSIGVWYHICVQCNATNIYLYVNGVQSVTPTAISGTVVAPTLSLFRIGQFNNQAGPNFYVGDVRLVYGATVYTLSGFTPSYVLTTSGVGTTALLLKTIKSYLYTTDTSSTPLSVTFIGSLRNDLKTPGADYSLYFPGVLGSYLAFSDARFNTNWATGQFTFEAWVNYNNFTNTVTVTPQPMSFGTMNDAGTNYWSFGANASGLLQFFYYNGGTVNVISTSQTMSAGVWYHICVQCNATNIYLYVNGVQSVTPTAISGTVVAPTLSLFRIGQFNNQAGPNFYVGDVRLVYGATVYTLSGFTPSYILPTSGVGTTSLLLRTTQSNGYMYLYINGILQNIGGTSMNGSPRYTSNSTLWIGSPSNITWGPSSMYIQDLRILANGNIPISSFTPSQAPFGYSVPGYTNNMGANVFSLSTQHLRNITTNISPYYNTVSATGGDSVQIINGNKIHIYSNVGTSTFTIPTNSILSNVQILIVGGGGGGGSVGTGGGGGAGGIIYLNSISLSNSTYNITVGNGGTPGNNGSPSSFINTTVGPPYPPVMSNLSMNGYIISASSTAQAAYLPASNANPWQAFDNNATTFWENFYGSVYGYSTTGAYVGTVSTGGAFYTTAGIYNGEWLQVQLPSPIILINYTIQARSGQESSKSPNTFVILGSNDGSNWTLLNTQTGITAATYASQAVVYFTISNPGIIAYTYFRIVIQNVQNTGSIQTINIAQWTLNPTIAIGGGTGGHVTVGGNGGSGGGSTDGNAAGSATQPSSTSGGFGNAGGGSAATAQYGTGGGGGAAAAGTTGTTTAPGNGGNGLLFNISGIPTYYAGGGGGGWNGAAYGGSGGLGGGGNGGNNATSGTPNTGGGGGGANNFTGSTLVSGSGGSGIVIISYPYTGNVVINTNTTVSSPLYSFSNFTFTSIGTTGASGPTSLSGYGTSYPGYGTSYALTILNSTSGIQVFTVPRSGYYNFIVAGATGGYATNVAFAGGTGQIISGTVYLQYNTILYIVVGQYGSTNAYQSAGGGGSFVFKNSLTFNNLLFAAGGGGGATHGTAGGNALSTTAGGSGTLGNPVAGGVIGLGGINGDIGLPGIGQQGPSVVYMSYPGNSATCAGGGGALSVTQGGGGGGAGVRNIVASSASIAGSGFIGGAAGTGGSGAASAGGFGGGGGSGSGNTGGGAGGGGGGYSGGGGGGGSTGTGGQGGGGGSYCTPLATNINLNYGTNPSGTTLVNNGYVTVQLIG